MRQIEIDHHWQFRDIDSSGSDISRHEYFNLAAFEVFKRLGSLSLAFVAMNSGSTNTDLHQISGELVRSVFGF
tara:strand:- start:8 stop:226 length:219 start_codon:yes stop_codon:yes gene_type:complete